MAADAAPARLFVPALPGTGEAFTLAPDEAHYVGRVCRAHPGDRVEASDGRGTVAVLRLLDLRGEVRAEVESQVRQDRRRRGWVLCGAPEGERGDWLVEKLAELGVARFIPVDCARGRWTRAGERTSRWERLAIAALRQSRRAWRMEIMAPADLADVVAAIPGEARLWLADAGGAATASPPVDPAADLAVGVVGPAAGLEERESALLLARGCARLRLSDARLRTETAAVAWAAWWSAGCPGA